MLAELMPPEVATVEAFGDLPGATLFPAEEAAVARAVDKRRREFTTARACARTALARLGLPAVPILRGAQGAPRWPPGIVGSITHCDGYRAAAVARAEDMQAIGVDAEPDERLPDGVLEAISLAEERAGLVALQSAAPGQRWDRLLFSAKESVYKAWFPLTQRFLSFEEAVIVFDPASHTFSARLLVPGPVLDGNSLTGFTGHWQAGDGLMVTAIAMPRRANPRRGQWPP